MTLAASSPSATAATGSNFADKLDMQHRLFTDLSRMFGLEVPLYEKSLLVNKVCNTAVCDLYSQMFHGFSILSEQLDRTCGERHGAIRIGTAEEYRLIGRFFAAFDMHPHNFYDMSNVGDKSQPVIATAFRARHNPEHRVFTSLLQADYFEPSIQKRIEALLATREVFSPRAKELLDKNERQGGLDWSDASILIREGCDRIFKWTGRARDHHLYTDLCDAGFKIAADIACFESHHLNHLTPNTLGMDLYTAAMKFCLGEVVEEEFRTRATRALSRLKVRADRDVLHLQFKHVTADQIDAYEARTPAPTAVSILVDSVTNRLRQPGLRLSWLHHSGFKDLTEGPSEDTPVLLRQDAYNALAEPVTFTNPDGSVTETQHTARFGEIEQRAYACTPKGRTLYDECLEQAEATLAEDPTLPERDFAAYEAKYAKPFAPFPKTLRALLDQGLIHARYSATAKGKAAKPSATDIDELIRLGFARVEGLRYEDFLPVSAAGIFASNLNQYGTKSTAAVKPTYTQDMLEKILNKKIIDATAAYAAIEARSLLETYADLALLGAMPPQKKSELERIAARA